MTVNAPEDLEIIEFDELAQDDDRNHVFCGVCYPAHKFKDGSMVICFCGTLTDVNDTMNIADVDCVMCMSTEICTTCGTRIFL